MNNHFFVVGLLDDEDHEACGVDQPSRRHQDQGARRQVGAGECQQYRHPAEADVERVGDVLGHAAPDRSQHDAEDGDGPDRAENDPAEESREQRNHQGRDRTGDQQEDGVVVECAERLVEPWATVDAVVERAGREQQDEANAVDADPDHPPEVPARHRPCEEQRCADKGEAGGHQVRDGVEALIRDMDAAVPAPQNSLHNSASRSIAPEARPGRHTSRSERHYRRIRWDPSRACGTHLPVHRACPVK